MNMILEQTEQDHAAIGREKLLAVVNGLIGARVGRDEDEHARQPGPWDPVIRLAVRRVLQYGPQPEPWRYVQEGLSFDTSYGRPAAAGIAIAAMMARHPELFEVAGGGRRAVEDELNPQPLPPRLAFLTALVDTVVSRAELLQDVAQSVAQRGQETSIIIVGGFPARFSDEFCGTEFRLVWRGPGPRPHWFPTQLDGVDLLVLASRFEHSAKQTFGTALRQSFVDASAKFAETGIARL